MPYFFQLLIIDVFTVFHDISSALALFFVSLTCLIFAARRAHISFVLKAFKSDVETAVFSLEYIGHLN